MFGEGKSSVTPLPDQPGTLDEDCTFSEEEVRQINDLVAGASIHVGTVFCIALVFGLPGSVLALVSLFSKAVSPTKRYMSFLAISDFAALLLANPTVYNITREPPSEILISVYFYRVFQTLSHWILVMICQERFVSVRYPFLKSRLYTRRATFLSFGAAFIMSLVLCFVGFSIDFYKDRRFPFALILGQTILQQLIYIIIPGDLIKVFTILTACHLRSTIRHRQTIATQAEQNSRLSVTMETQLTRIMVVTVVCFAVLTFPLAFFNIFLSDPKIDNCNGTAAKALVRKATVLTFEFRHRTLCLF
ncbi:hypothetical protein RRG08_054769 [Elysia crispata]|uniref:G-protein coupled receptors family 1 profile domain-containing protein n=1 Tax=Elysia crispata TaxID=231223 RepID=A0AAE0YX95_9GAST|nr:hypothetical protein RRG08_054769 [Elysia crispata]